MNELNISLKFIKQKASLNWSMLLWGYKNSILCWKDLVEYAVEKVSTGSNEPSEIELSSVNKDTIWKISEQVDKLTEKDSVSDEIIRKKWLYLCLAWLFENQNKFKDPFQKIEDLYEDFDYPTEIESFVGYMPDIEGIDTAKYTLEENRKRLTFRWEKYLNEYCPRDK